MERGRHSGWDVARAYAILESIRAALTGYQVPGARKIFMVSEKFVERDPEGGVWIYLISIALMTLAVEPSTVEEFPLFIKGVAEEIGGGDHDHDRPHTVHFRLARSDSASERKRNRNYGYSDRWRRFRHRD